MFPDSPFAPATGSFERPVPLVLVDPCAEPTVTLRINREWIPYMLGALKQLVLQATWNTTDPDDLNLVQARAMSLLSCIGVSADEPGCDCGCADYLLSDPIITWAPGNPYTDPEFVPSGYRFPPWYVVNNVIPFTTLQQGDVLTDLLHGPIVEPISSGFPRFRVMASGTGTVEITFVRFPTAGVALITVDNQIGTARFVDLHMTLAASIGTAIGEMIIPVEITTPGDHFVDVTMLYSITEAPPFVHFGGGIRKVALCGFGLTPHPVPITQYVEEWKDDVSLCDSLRYHNGKLQARCCWNADTCTMDWCDICGQEDGTIPDGTVQPGTGSRPAAGETKCYTIQLNANNQWLLPFNVTDGDVVEISEVSGAWSDGTPLWYCPDGHHFVFGSCVGTPGHDGGDPDTTDWHMQLIAQVGTVYYPASGGSFTLPGGTGNQQLILMANDGSRSDNVGSLSLKICVTNGSTPPATEWCQILDFSLSDYGWTLDQGTYVPGTGFIQAYVGGSNAVAIEAPSSILAGINYTEVDWLFDYHQGTFAPAGNAWINNVGGTEYPATGSGATTDGDGQIFTWTGDETNPSIIAGYFRCAHNVNDGTATIRGITLKGVGTNPFPSSNC